MGKIACKPTRGERLEESTACAVHVVDSAPRRLLDLRRGLAELPFFHRNGQENVRET